MVIVILILTHEDDPTLAKYPMRLLRLAIACAKLLMRLLRFGSIFFNLRIAFSNFSVNGFFIPLGMVTVNPGHDLHHILILRSGSHVTGSDTGR